MKDPNIKKVGIVCNDFKVKHPRPGLTEKKLIAGDLVTFTEVFNNFYGSFARVEKDGISYDIKPSNLKRA